MAIYTDGYPAMFGKHTGVVSLIQEFIERRIITHHYIIHQKAWCGKILKFDHVMPAVVLVVNYLRARALNIKHFEHSWKRWMPNIKI